MGHTDLVRGLTHPHPGCPQRCKLILYRPVKFIHRSPSIKRPSNDLHIATRNASGSTRPGVPRAAASSFSEPEPQDGSSSQTGGHKQDTVPVKLLALISLVLVTGVSNRVLYRMALVPLQDHIFFLAQFQNLGYLAVYFTALAWRIRSGQVTPAMLAVDKRPLAVVGACEAVSQLLFMVGASHLPGPLLPLVNQTYLVWSLAFASLILGTRYSRSQLAGAALVMAGVLVAAVQPTALATLLGGGGAGAGAAASSAAASAAAAAASVELRYVAVCVACFAFPAIANCIKERVFRSAASSLGRPLDIFVVNSFGSLAQAAFVLLLLPLTTALKGIALPDLPAHLAASARVFLGQVPPSQSAAAEAAAAAAAAGGPGGELLARYAAPLLALSYVVMNLAFNISILTLLRSVGSVTTTLVGSSLVPLTIAAFTLPLPYLEPVCLGPRFVVGAALLMCGLAAYNWNSWQALAGRRQAQAQAQGAAKEKEAGGPGAVDHEEGVDGAAEAKLKTQKEEGENTTRLKG